MSNKNSLEILEHLIYNENKIVTCQFLCKEMHVHVDISKKYMADFLQGADKKNLCVNYFLAGILEYEGKKSFKVAIVSEEALDKEKQLFSKVTSCHVYSLCCKKVDENLLYNAVKETSKDATKNTQYCAIQHPSVRIQPKVLIKATTSKPENKNVSSEKQSNGSAKPSSSNNLVAVTAEKKESINKLSTNSSKDGVVSESSVEVTPTSSDKPKEDSKNAKANPLAAMWQKKEEKTQSAKSDTAKSSAKGKAKDNSKVTPKNNIMSMFSKQKEKNASIPPKQSTTVEYKSEPIKKSPVEEEKVLSKADKDETAVFSKSSLKTYGSKRKPDDRRTTKKSSKKQNSDDSEDEFQSKKKKHRRICTFDSDSESENEEAQDIAQRNLLSSEDPIETPKEEDTKMGSSDESEEPIPPTPPVVNGKAKKKVWKTVNKTFEDEDGFFVTKQEKELVSEDDEDPLPKKKSPAKDAFAPKLFTNQKQASLTSFFSKK